MIEYRNYNLKNCENDAIYFDVYKDDELFDFRVDTCIFVINNNENISGNIDFYVISSPNINKKIPNSETNISKKEIIIENEKNVYEFCIKIINVLIEEKIISEKNI
jgi:hypothetical protein